MKLYDYKDYPLYGLRKLNINKYLNKWKKYFIHLILRAIITGPSNSGKTYFLTNLILNIIDDFQKIYIYSPSLHQDLYQKLIKCFNAFLPLHVIQNILNEDISIDDLDSCN